ncbi:hypothetical protein PR202_gn00679 [Eleusine coracana subsp. coracana]|uniref:Uncharacterized protein n=1 Tax=Eleusine coracana subsp. coracana TaxID=191504 RepID=A0AAV5G096_ELECO|nr:hypothetical protein PR202_gn00679 [Eleusine coracana subsp. coracana]
MGRYSGNSLPDLNLTPHALHSVLGPSGPCRHCGVSSDAQCVHRRRGGPARRGRRRKQRREAPRRRHPPAPPQTLGPRPHHVGHRAQAHQRARRRRLRFHNHGLHRGERVHIREPLQLLFFIRSLFPLCCNRQLQPLQEPLPGKKKLSAPESQGRGHGRKGTDTVWSKKALMSTPPPASSSAAAGAFFSAAPAPAMVAAAAVRAQGKEMEFLFDYLGQLYSR